MPPGALARLRAEFCSLCRRRRRLDHRGFAVCTVCDVPPAEVSSLADVTMPIPRDLRRAYESGRGHENPPAREMDPQ